MTIKYKSHFATVTLVILMIVGFGGLIFVPLKANPRVDDKAVAEAYYLNAIQDLLEEDGMNLYGHTSSKSGLSRDWRIVIQDPDKRVLDIFEKFNHLVRKNIKEIRATLTESGFSKSKGRLIKFSYGYKTSNNKNYIFSYLCDKGEKTEIIFVHNKIACKSKNGFFE